MVDGDIVLSVGLDADDAISTSDTLTEDLRQIFGSMSGDTTSVAFKNLQMQMDKAIIASENLRTKLSELGSSVFLSDEYVQIGEQAEIIEQKFRQLNDERRKLEAAGKIDTSEYKLLEIELDKLQSQADALAQTKRSMELDGSMFISGEDTQEYADTVQKLNQINNQMVILRQRALSAGSAGAQSGMSINTAYSSVNTTTNSLKSTFDSLISKIKRVGAELKKLGSKGISIGLKSLKEKFKGVGNASDDTSKSLQKGFKMLIKYTFGVRSFFFLYRKIRKAISEGFGELAQVHEPFNNAMSQMKTSLQLLRNTLAAAFAPIVETVAPAISQFINMLADAISMVGQFIAALTGKEYVHAGTTYVDYAKSLDKSSKSSKNATKQTKEQTEAQKKLNREITHFDDLVILHENKDKDKDETPTTTPSTSTFTPMAIGDAVNQFAKDFKAAWAKADFTDIGRKLGEKLKNMLENIPWEKIQAGARKIAKSIATFLNGFLETPGLWTVVGQTIGQAINTALAALSTFAWNFHWDSLGKAVGETIKSALDTINWDDAFSAAEGFGRGLAMYLNGILNTPGLFESIGDTVANLINVRLTGLNKFAWTFEWDSLGTAIRKAIVHALGNIDWRLVHSTVAGFATGLADFLNSLFKPSTFIKVGDTAARLLNEAFHFLAVFGAQFDWVNFGTSLAMGLNKFLARLDINEFSKGIHALVVGIRDGIVAWLDKVDWEKFGTTLRDLILAIPWFTILESVGKVIWYAIKAAIRTAKGIFTGEDSVGKPVIQAFEKLQDTINSIEEKLDFEEIAKGFKAVVDALKPAVEGFATGFIYVFDRLVEIGGEFLERLGPALQSMADALNSMDPDLVKGIGIALGAIAAALVIIKLAEGAIGIIAGLAGPLMNLAGAAESAATAIGSGSVAMGGFGLVGAFAALVSVVGVFLFALEEFGITTADAVKDERQFYETTSTLSGSLSDVAMECGLTSEQFEQVTDILDLAANNAIPDASKRYAELEQYLQDSGVDLETFRKGVQGVIDESDDAYVIAALSKYIDQVGGSSESAEGQATGLSAAFDAFDGLSLKTPLKMLLLSTAVKNLGDAGLLSDEQVGDLQNTLDHYDPKHPEKALDTLKTAFKDAGIKASDFNTSVVTAMAEMPPATRSEIQKAIKVVMDAGTDFKQGGKTDAQQVAAGLKEGAEESHETVKTAFGNVAIAGLGGIDTALDSNSPSKEAIKRGEYVGQGLGIGITNSAPIVISASTKLANLILKAFNGQQTRFQTVGNAYLNQLGVGLIAGSSILYSAVNSVVTEIQKRFTGQDWGNVGKNVANDIGNGIRSVKRSLTNLAYDIGEDMRYNIKYQGWESLGRNIGWGIYDGLFYTRSWLRTCAWNTAVEMYNAACRALGIASPAKKFIWIGEMISTGWGKGIEDNADVAVDAVTDMATDMTEAAEDANPVVAVGTSVENWIDALDEVLTKFSETVINRFDNMITTLTNLANVSGSIPGVAQGLVVPSSVVLSTNVDDNVSEIKGMLDSLASQQISYDELRSMLVEIFDQFMNIDFYIGDEQIARHANNGNLLLNRRYSIMKS